VRRIGENDFWNSWEVVKVVEWGCIYAVKKFLEVTSTPIDLKTMACGESRFRFVDVEEP